MSPLAMNAHMQKGEPLMVMLTLDDAVAVCMRFLHETTYFDDMPREEYENMSEFITGEFEQKCWIISDSELAKRLPSAQPEVILCNSCKHWTQSTGKMTGYGLGRCDFHDADLVTCNGFCYWAERRTDGKTT